MPTPFDGITLQKAEGRLNKVQDAGLKQNEQFYDGDHWQEGQAWVGPLPNQLEPSFTLIFAEIKKAFTSRNVIREVVRRHMAGVVGVAPSWAVVPRRDMKDDDKPTAEEQKEIDELEGWLTEWWNARKVHSFLQKIVARSLHQARGVMRLYVPRGELATATETSQAANGARVERTVTRVPAGDVQAQLKRIYPDAPKLGAAAIIEDAATKKKAGVLVYEIADDEGNNPRKVLEITYLDGVQTVVREVTETSDRLLRLDFGERLPMYELEQELLITEQVRQAQRSLNLALTTIPKNVTTADWLERIILGGMAPGDFEYDAAGHAIPGTWTSKPFYTGAHTTNFISPIEAQNPETGNRTLSSPSVVFREPIGITTSKEATDKHYTDILSECDQGHVVLAGESLPSGKSREAARADHDTRLGATTAEVEPGAAWILETALAMAEAFAGTPGKYTKRYRVVMECRVRAATLDANEKAADVTAVEKGFLSREMAMERAGVVDVDAENARIAADSVNQLALRKRQAEALQALVTAGATLAAAAKLIGMPDDEIETLIAVDEFEDDPNGADDPPVDDNEGDNPIPPDAGGDSDEGDE